MPSQWKPKRNERRSSLLNTPRDGARSLQLTHNIRHAGDFLEAQILAMADVEYLRTVLRRPSQVPGI